MTSNTRKLKWGRRTVLKTVGAGTAGALFGGVASAGKACPECPDGTALLAKYEWDGENWVPEEEVGACPAAITDITNTKEKDGDPLKVEYSSKLYVHSVLVKAGPECELDPDGGTNDEKDGSFEGTTESPNNKGISHINFCAPVCFQTDFVEGDPIVDFDEEGQYGEDRLILARWGGTTDEHTPDTADFTGDDGSYTTDDGCELTVEPDEISFENGTAKVTFTVESVDADGCELSLVSYVATCPPNYDVDTDGLQVLFDSAPDYEDSYVDTQTVDNTFEEKGEVTLTVELPGLEHLDLLCENV